MKHATKRELTAASRRSLLRHVKLSLALLPMLFIGLMGCASKPSNPTEAAASSLSGNLGESAPKLIVTPDVLLIGNVTAYNTAGRFVVLDFPVGRMPMVEQVLFIYRQGLKVGEVRVTGPERDHNTIADLISGEAQKGDEVRDK